MKRALSFVVAAAPLVGPVSAAQDPWQVGRPLPHVHLSTLAGEPFDLDELRGRRLLLIEFASW